jgi:ADP-heptose:LPS heptosyltransferase
MSHGPRRLLLDQRQAAGDVLVLTAAVRDLMRQYPGVYEVDYCGHHGRLSDGNNLFANSPYITPFYEGPPHDLAQHCVDCRYIMCDYSYAIQRPHRDHFLKAFHESLSHKLGVPIEFTEFKPDLHLSLEEREPWPGLPERYIFLNAGWKNDFTAKQYSSYRFQKVVDALHDRIAFVQVGSSADNHPALNNVINLVGQTNLRQTIRVMYGASLCITANSYPMHLAAAVPTKTGDIRPCIVLAGRREQSTWCQYPGHALLGSLNKLDCGERLGSGCWRSKVRKVDNDNSICRNPVQDEAGQWITECLHRVTAENIIRSVEECLGI